MRRLLAILALTLCLSTAASAQQTVMPVPLVGTGAGLDSAAVQSGTGGVATTGATSFYGMSVTLITGQGPGYIMLWDATAIPADGAVTPMRCFYVDAGPRTITLGSTTPLAMINGIAWSYSTGANCQTKAAATANFVAVSYKQTRR